MRGELAHGRVGVHYPRQNVAPRGIGERPEQPVQNVRRWLSIYNHLVVDSSTPGQVRVRVAEVLVLGRQPFCRALSSVLPRSCARLDKVWCALRLSWLGVRDDSANWFVRAA